MADVFAVFVSTLSPVDKLPGPWREVTVCGSETAAHAAATALRSNDTVARILDAASFDCEALRAEIVGEPSDLYAAATVDRLVGHSVVVGDWTRVRETAQTQADAFGGIVVTASASGPRGMGG